jgi:hypothetical protein
VVIATTVFLVLYFRRRAGNHRLYVEGVEPRPFVSNCKHMDTIKANYIPHSDLPDPQSSSPLAEQISYLSPSPPEITPFLSAMPQVTRPSAQTSALPSKLIVPNPPTADPTTPVPLVSTSHHPQPPGFTTHPAPSVTLPLVPLSVPAIGQATDPEAELLLRLYNLQIPAADIARVVAATTGTDQSTVEDTRLLRRLYSLGVPTADISLIIDAMRRHGVAYDDTADSPPGYDFDGR